MRLLRQLFWVSTVLGVLLGIVLLFTYDIIKIEWISFMEIQPSYRPMEDPLPVPARSIPIEGPVTIAGMLPENPMPGDEASITRGANLFEIHCQMCHGQTGEGTGPIAAFLIKFKPANLTSPVVQSKSDGSIFLTITNGLEGRMPPLNENLTVSERWDVVNFVRTLQAEPSE
ncbi:MAG TPA: c-type cytochrome [Anaerolineales bacterium]|nr:c-type cytochrome [Anaerolineales bacterium]